MVSETREFSKTHQSGRRDFFTYDRPVFNNGDGTSLGMIELGNHDYENFKHTAVIIKKTQSQVKNTKTLSDSVRVIVK